MYIIVFEPQTYTELSEKITLVVQMGGSNLGLLNLSDSTVNTEGGDLRCRAGFGERSQY